MSGRFWLIAVLSLIAMALIGVKVALPKMAQKSEDTFVKMTVGKAQLQVMIADESNEMEKGLGYRDSLGKNEGMVFVYPYEVIPRFWMKGMRFDLDFLWIADDTVVEITEGVPAQLNAKGTYDFYAPYQPITRVLEVNAGWVYDNGITVGSEVQLDW